VRLYLQVFALWFALCFGGFWAYAALFPLAYLDPEFAIWQAKEELLAAPCAGPCPELVVLGDSCAVAGVDPRQLSVPAINLALGGGTAMEAYYVLARWLESHTPPKTVVLSLSPYHFQESLFWERLTRYHFLRFGEQREALAALRRFGTPPLVNEATGGPVAPSLWDALLYRAWFPSKYSNSVIEARAIGRLGENRAFVRDVIAQRGYKAFGARARNDESNGIEKRPEQFFVAGVLDRYMDRLLDLAADRGIAVRFYVMPYNPASWAIAERERAVYVAGYHAHLNALAERAANFTLLNALWVLPADHFGDSSHVNPRGLAVVREDLERRLAR
jgi:hypothetical protein